MARQFTSAMLSLGVLLGWLAPRAVAQEKPEKNVATTVQLPSFGISIDAAGVLKLKSFSDPRGQLMRQRLFAAQAELPGDLARISPLRKISLRRLEAEVAARLADGRPLEEEIRYLAGLQRLKYVFLYPEEKDIVIAGPAQGWVQDLSGRVVGIQSGRPVLELEDLVVALRAFPAGGKPPASLGCSIDPSPDSLVRLREFQRTVPAVVRQRQRRIVGIKVAKGVEEALGMADVRVWGVPADTHFAHTLIEADYRMKMIGVGRERAPIKLASYLDLLTPSAARTGSLQRFWFTPNYECVKVTEDRLAMELEGQGVQLQTEDKVILPGGGLANSGRANRSAELFVGGFTRKYPELSAKRPVFAQLRNLIDMCVAAAFLQQEDYYGKAGWRMETWSNEKVYQVAGKPTPRQAPCVANSRWKGSRLIAPAGGGVTIVAQKALNPELVKADANGKLKRTRHSTSTQPKKRWWWD